MVTLEDADNALKLLYLRAVAEPLKIENTSEGEILIKNEDKDEVEDYKRKEDLYQKQKQKCYNAEMLAEKQEGRRNSMKSRKMNWKI